MASSIVCIARPRDTGHDWGLATGCLVALTVGDPPLPQFAQNRMDGRIALIGVGAVVGDGLLGGKSHGVIADHARGQRDASDGSLGSHG